MKKEMSAGNQIVPVAIKMCALLLGSICLGCILLSMVYLFPAAPINRHLEESVPVFEEEGAYPRKAGWCSSTLDNFTDALMLLTAAYNGEGRTIDKAMDLYFETVESTPAFNPVNSILNYGAENVELTTRTYTRYWGGYLIFLKPLLSVMNYQQIRILNQIFQMAVLLLLVFLLKRGGYGRFIPPLLISMGLLPLIVNAQSLTYSDVYYLSTGGSCVLLLNWKRWKDTDKILLFFFTLGILTSFFDFLTYPLVSFGIPVCLYFCVEGQTDFGRAFKRFVPFGFAWGLGYAGMWAGKWVCASILTGKNVMQEALSSVQLRSGSTLDGEAAIRLSDTILRNVGEWGRTPLFILFWLFCIITLLWLLKKDNFESLGRSLIFLPIACLPFAWYIVVRNHSYIHYFFTYKEMVVFAFAVMCFFANSLPTARTKGAKIGHG